MGGLFERGGGAVLNLEMTMVSVLHKELESSTRSFRSYSRGSESNANFQLVNKSSWISPHEVLQWWLINIGYQLLVKNKLGRGGGLNREGRLINFLPLKRGRRI